MSDSDVCRLIAAAYEASEQFGDYVRTHAETGSRSSQLAALRVCDLQYGPNPRLLVPRSKKGRPGRVGENSPVPITPALAVRLKAASAGRPPSAPLLLRPNGAGYPRMVIIQRHSHRSPSAPGCRATRSTA